MYDMVALALYESSGQVVCGSRMGGTGQGIL